MILRKRKTFLKKRKTARWCNYGCLARKVLSDRYMSKPRAVIGEHAVLISGCVIVGRPPGTARDCQGVTVDCPPGRPILVGITGLFVVVRQVEWLKERVGHALCGEVGAWAVARDDLD